MSNYRHTDTKTSTLVDGLYQEFDASGRVVFSYKFRHPKTVRFEGVSDGFLTEFDKWDRTTFTKDSTGYWSLKYYDEPTEPNRVEKMPYHVVHKHWNYYNNL